MFEAVAIIAIYFGFITLCCVSAAVLYMLYIFVRILASYLVEKFTEGGEETYDE